jgi:integrase/recombinase XerD
LPVEKPVPKLDALNAEQIDKVRASLAASIRQAYNEETAWLATRNALIVEVIAQLGLKPAEVIKMQWHHIKLDEKELMVIANKGIRSIHADEALLQKLLQFRTMSVSFMPTFEKSNFIWLATSNERGEPITVKTIERIFLAITKDVEFKVTATNVRYYALAERATIEEAFKELGYARKTVMKERIVRMLNDQSEG